MFGFRLFDCGFGSLSWIVGIVDVECWIFDFELFGVAILGFMSVDCVWDLGLGLDSWIWILGFRILDLSYWI